MLAQEAARKVGTQWAEMVIRDDGAQAFVWSMESPHSLKEIAGVPLYGHDLVATKWTGSDSLSLVVDLLKGHAHR
jgi:hypothetical protein